MNAKENWLIAWSITRNKYNSNNHVPRLPKEIRLPKDIKKILKIAEKCLCEREEWKTPLLEGRLENHIQKNGFQKRWTGWKYTWIVKEKPDVDF